MTRPPATRRLGTWAGWGCVAALGVLHGAAIWVGMGGRAGLTGDWPIWRDDHPLYYHSALATRHFLRQTGTTAGYDPSFMSGYAKSIIFPSSSTLPELVVAAFGGRRPERAYKLYVFASAALIPWLVAGAAASWRARAGTVAVAVGLFLVYVWTDFPINYAAFGMLPYLLVIPIGLMATGVFVRYLDRGGFGRWLASAAMMAAVILVHPTGAMIVAPAAGLSYVAAVPGVERSRWRLPATRHLGVWAIPALVLAVNAFWWLPGIWLASTKGPSGFAFAHPEGVLVRLRQVVWSEAPIQSVLVALGALGLVALARADRVGAAGLIGFVAAGFGWGYLAGGLRSLDFLQPGRHTYAFYSGLSLASAVGLSGVLDRLKEGAGGRLDRWAAAGLVVVGMRLFGPAVVETVQSRMGGRGREPFLTSRPSPRLLWVVDRVKRHVRPGERLLYEEGGFGLPGVADPFQGGRFSGLIPERTGVEMIGGPYLHASLTTNFTQFGEGSLFGEADWGREQFVRYARLYRPSAIVCWSPRARAFCRDNPDLIQIRDDDGAVLIGRVEGFGGDAIEGTAEVEATPGRLRVRGASAGVDGTVVLRYHSVPCLRADPPARWEPVSLERDPVPFIRLLPPFADTALELRFPPGRGGGAGGPDAARGPGPRVAPSPGKE
jgi:hypothetical protein